MEVERVASLAAKYYLDKTPYENALELDSVNASIEKLRASENADQMNFTVHHEHRAAIKFVLRLSQRSTNA